MGAPPPPRLLPGERVTSDVFGVDAFVQRAVMSRRGEQWAPQPEHVLPLSGDVARIVGRAAGTSVTVRIRRPEALPVVIRTWQGEVEILGAVKEFRVYRWIEIVRSAYADLDRLVTGASLDAPDARRAMDTYAMTLAAARGSLGLPARSTANPYPARALEQGARTAGRQWLRSPHGRDRSA